MASTVFRNCAILIVLLLLDAARVGALGQQSAELNRQDARIIGLLVQLADQARLSEDPAFRVRAQSEAAILLWPRDRERARAIFRRVFQSLMPSGSDGAKDESWQLRAELLYQIAGRDAELAEELTRTLAYSADKSKEASSAAPAGDGFEQDGGFAADASLQAHRVDSTQGEIERRELLVSIALQIVERDPHRAMILGQLSLGSLADANGHYGRTSSSISPQLARLLTLMRAADTSLADLLFSNAVARLERAPSVDLADIHTLGSYLVSAANSSNKDSITRPVIVRFLNLAYKGIMSPREQASLDRSAAAFDRASRLDESAALYFISRQLGDLFARYTPERFNQLKDRLAEINDVSTSERVVVPSHAQATDPADAAREARETDDERERDLLYARAALGWLAKGEMGESQSAAAQIKDAEMRDRILVQVARRLTSEGRIEEAAALARRIEDSAARVGVMVKLAGAALASRDRVRATELLNEAEGVALKAQPSLARSESLLSIVSALSAYDALRAFEVMQGAIKSINQSPGPQEETKPSAAPRTYKPDELYRLGFESTFAVLARSDFDRALLLAQQLSIKDVSLIAQMAVCRGGLSDVPSKVTEKGGAGAKH